MLLAVSFLLRAMVGDKWLRYRYLGVTATASAMAAVFYAGAIIGIGPSGIGKLWRTECSSSCWLCSSAGKTPTLVVVNGLGFCNE